MTIQVWRVHISRADGLDPEQVKQWKRGFHFSVELNDDEDNQQKTKLFTALGTVLLDDDKLMINQTFHYKIEANSNEVNHLRISLLEAEADDDEELGFATVFLRQSTAPKWVPLIEEGQEICRVEVSTNYSVVNEVPKESPYTTVEKEIQSPMVEAPVSASISVGGRRVPTKAAPVSPTSSFGRILLLLLGVIICLTQLFMATRIPFYSGQVMFAGESKASCFGLSTPICTARTLSLTDGGVVTLSEGDAVIWSSSTKSRKAKKPYHLKFGGDSTLSVVQNSKATWTGSIKKITQLEDSMPTEATTAVFAVQKKVLMTIFGGFDNLTQYAAPFIRKLD